MSDRAQPHPAIALLARETAPRAGPVPDRIGGVEVPPGWSALIGDEYLLRTASGFGFHYRRGGGVTVESPPGSDPAEMTLWLRGSVYAAAASINGFLPIHASAVAWGGRVFAFGGPSGAGKSTLTAALGRHGLPLFCDDTLVLDIADPARIVCLPGHKRLKLLPDALALSGAQAQDAVGVQTGKVYAQARGGTVAQALPLAELVFLEFGDGPALLPVRGAERLARLNDDHYTAELYALARGEGLAARFAHFARLAPAIAMCRFVRPRDAACFEEGAQRIAAHVKEGTG